MLSSWLLAVYAAAVGLAVGSYLNVVIHRLPRGASTVRPRSRCPVCGAAIRWHDNLPLLSYLRLGGRCRRCGARISWRYPAVEALTAFLFLGVLLRFGFAPQALVAALLAAGLVALAVIDLEHFLLPDKITLPGIAVGLASQWVAPLAGPVPALIGTVLGAGVLLAVAGGYYWLRREEGMGLGDVKMLAMVGAFLGWKGVLVTLFFGSLAGAATGLVLLATARDPEAGEAAGAGMKTRLPFGTFLALAALFALFWGEPIADAYLTLL